MGDEQTHTGSVYWITGLAAAGKTHAEILRHYYRGSHLHRLY